MRLIDADALIEALGIAEDCQDCQYKIGVFCKNSSDFVNACEAICDAPTIEAEWIPVSERLPEYDGDAYLVTDYCEQINRRRIHISYCYINREGFWSDVPLDYKVIAWMPLPEPWKGEKK